MATIYTASALRTKERAEEMRERERERAAELAEAMKNAFLESFLRITELLKRTYVLLSNSLKWPFRNLP